MNRRSNQILNELLLGEQTNIADFAATYRVQERTIRAEIKELNQALKQYKLPQILINMDGYVWMDGIDRVNFEMYEAFIRKYHIYNYAMSKNERKTILTMILLNSVDYITIEMISEKTGASRNTLLRDLTEVKTWFGENGMQLISRVRKGYILMAGEDEIRKNILRLLEVNGDYQLYKHGHHLSVFWNLLLEATDLMGIYDKVREALIEEEDHQQVFLSDFSFFEALMEMVVVQNRLAIGKALKTYPERQGEKIKSSSKYSFAKNLFGILKESGEVEIPEVEVLNYTVCLRRKSYLKNNSSQANAINMFHVQILISEVINQISNNLGIESELDYSLYNQLVDQMRSAVNRMQNGEERKNPIKQELLRAYPDIFDTIKRQMSQLEEFLGHEMSDDELSFLVAYFASVFEEEKAQREKETILPVSIVCTSGRANAQLMAARLKCIDTTINIVSISSAHHIDEIKDKGARMIISSGPLPDSSLPYIQVKSPVLSQEDVCRIQAKAMKVKEESEEECLPVQKMDDGWHKPVGQSLGFLLTEEGIQLDDTVKNWEEAVQRAGSLLHNMGAVSKEYIDEMVRNVKENSSYAMILPEIALLYGEQSAYVNQEAVCILRLKDPVEFQDRAHHRVRYVVALSMISAENIYHAVYVLMRIFGNQEKRNQLDQITDAAKMMSVVEQERKIRK